MSKFNIEAGEKPYADGKFKTLLRALKVSIKIKGPFSLFISFLGFPAALLPVILAGQLAILTDELQILMGGDRAVSYALTIFAIVVTLYVAQVLIGAIQRHVNGIDEIKIGRYIQRAVMHHKCNVKYKYIENHDDFQNRIAFTQDHAGRTMAQSMGSIISLLQRVVAFVAASFAMWSVNPIIVLLLYVTAVPAAILAYIQQDETFRRRTKWMEEGHLAMHYYQTILGAYHYGNMQEVRHYGLFDYMKKRWRTIADAFVTKNRKLMAKHVRFNIVADFLRSAVYLGVLLIAAHAIYVNPTVGLGAFTLVFALTGQLQGVTSEVFVGIMTLKQNIPYMQEFFYLDTLEREDMRSGTAISTGEIVFEGVNFSYPNTEAIVLRDINICIRNGEKIAVVGENGSGKSTFISLVCGMFEPQEGKIHVGAVQPVQARSGVSVVFQDFAHYDSSLRDNITVSDKSRNASDDEIMALLRSINVADVIEEQTEGLSELVGSFSEKTNNLSGGQWQKISIARAAYRKDAKIMILDEPTSALDPLAEAQLYHNFSGLTGDKTTILISHRLGITATVDRILVFHEGRIVEDGSHADLIKQDGYYAEMYRAQAQWYQ